MCEFFFNVDFYFIVPKKLCASFEYHAFFSEHFGLHTTKCIGFHQQKQYKRTIVKNKLSLEKLCVKKIYDALFFKFQVPKWKHGNVLSIFVSGGFVCFEMNFYGTKQ